MLKNQDTKKSYGKLYGVGVGTGASDLLTLRAVNILRSVDTIAIPRSSLYASSVAWRIASPAVGKVEGQEHLYLEFPMTRDSSLVRPAWEKALGKIEKVLLQKKSLAFITEGDPLFFSTYIYLHQEAKKRWPGIHIEIVPGVSSFTAVASVASLPIADGQEKVAVIPARYGLDDLPEILRSFDTILLMKVSSVMPELVQILEKEGLLDCSVYVSRATMPYQKIEYNLKNIQNDSCDYFSMVVVRKTERSGVLMGATSQDKTAKPN